MILLAFIFSFSADRGIDPYMVLGVMKVESNFNQKLCYRGAYGIMQVQVLGHRKCNNGSKAIAGKRGLLDLKRNIEVGIEAMVYWRQWCKTQNHTGHHWLLHYNQGFGACPDKSTKCDVKDRQVSLRHSHYAEEVLRWQRKYRKIIPQVLAKQLL